MTSLDFLYIALGIGFLFLVVFVCVMIVFLILILRDVNKVTENVKEASDRVNDYIMEPMRFLEKFLSRFTFLSAIFDRVKAEMDKHKDHDEDEKDEEEEKHDVKRKMGFKVNKMK